MSRNAVKIFHRCPKCGKKKEFLNTRKFRVNANARRVDVWLIYRCGKCKKTWNLTVYERKKPEQIPAEEYQRFLDNDPELAAQYGSNREFLKRNGAEFC